MTLFARSARIAAAVTTATLFATGCSGSGTIDQAAVEEEAATQLAATVDDGTTPDISCPDDLDSEVGSEMTCELTVEGDSTVYPVYIEVTDVEDGVANFSVEVGEAPEG